MTAIVRLSDVRKEYVLGATTVSALAGVSLEVPAAQFLAISGPSGSGKTSLLNLIGCVDTPTSGTIEVAGQDTTRLSERELTSLRLRKIGFIFQSFNLVPVLSAFQNIELPLLLLGNVSNRDRKQRVNELLDRVGLSSLGARRPAQLSGGQRQRVAVARALVVRPSLVLADEPTANLDSATGQSILELMKDMNRAEGTTFIFSTHDQQVLAHADLVLKMIDGRVAATSSRVVSASPPELEPAHSERRVGVGSMQ